MAPVIISLTDMGEEEARRLVDFAAGPGLRSTRYHRARDGARVFLSPLRSGWPVTARPRLAAGPSHSQNFGIRR